MKCFVGPVDAVGNLWMIRPAASRGHLRLERAGAPKQRAEIHVSRPTALDEDLGAAIRDGRAVVVLEPASAFVARVERIGARLGDEGWPVEWVWGEMHGGRPEPIDDERGALAWFLRQPADVLVMESVAFQKRRPSVSLHAKRARIDAARVAPVGRSALRGSIAQNRP
ncbi:MAG: hypothetical protein U0234_12395 [Sandaracinus sp.]